MNSTGRFNAQDNVIKPENSALVLVDYQTLLLLGIQSHDRTQLTQNIVGLAKAAQTFEVPTVLTTMAADDFGGPLIPELQEVFPALKVNTRTAINPWEDENFQSTVKEFRRKRLIIAGLWTEVSLSLPAQSALDEGYNVYFVADACGGLTAEAHQIAIQQLIQAGAKPRTWQQLLYLWQRDWACLDTANAVRDIIRCHGSAFPPSAIYTSASSVGAQGARALQAPRRGVRPAGMGKSI
jgi:nicotinamidase-related amidase